MAVAVAERLEGLRYRAQIYLVAKTDIACVGGWKQALCCTPEPDLSEFYCSKSTCDLFKDFCPADDYYWNDADDDPDDANWPKAPQNENDDDDGDLRIRDLVAARNNTDLAEAHKTALDLAVPKGTSGRRPFQVEIALNIILYLFARRYPGPSRLYRGANGRRVNQYAFR